MRKTILVALLLGASHLWAADGGTIPVENKKPALVKSGDHYYLDMKDGRVAGFFRQNGPIARAPINMRQIENTCDYGQALTNCHIDFDISSSDLSLKWVKHPDASKINQTVRKFTGTDADGNRTFIELGANNSLDWWYHARNDKTYKASFKKDVLVCDSFVWLKNLPVVNGRIKIDSWASEFMFQSRETQVNENQSMSQATDVILQKINERSYEFTAFGPSKYLGDLPPYASTQTASITFIDKNKQQCQVSFESSLDQIFKVIQDPQFRKTDPNTSVEIANYSTLKNNGLAFEIDSIISSTEGVELE